PPHAARRRLPVAPRLSAGAVRGLHEDVRDPRGIPPAASGAADVAALRHARGRSAGGRADGFGWSGRIDTRRRELAVGRLWKPGPVDHDARGDPSRRPARTW